MEAGVICILLAHFGAFNFGELKMLFNSTMYTLCRDWSLLRAIEGNTSHIKIFLIVRIQFVIGMDCQFMLYKGYVTRLNFS